MQPSEAVRSLAERLLVTHALRAADAFQLAAAIQRRGAPPNDVELVSYDGRLRAAAHAEGFVVLPA